MNAYLFDVAAVFARFYDACTVLKAEDSATRDNRIALTDLTGRTLATGLDYWASPRLHAAAPNPARQHPCLQKSVTSAARR
ncbi:DALR anticodon binding domain-containing protein [Promicromonospora umidemergens]|uniref:DALR anticodon binding domain-containing protein n=2 Tax=Promicromonospora umidemergens TaxID=629679 RepID=A0ABP8XYF0_9MICO|nr:DALR anticodon-binding domain-containing protein [Promicromonospora umidemergens]MCP2286012.1 DALR anticodon binding domain-containing protein [Promicromonospora umidemergens]